jgi:hypothetical protein
MLSAREHPARRGDQHGLARIQDLGLLHHEADTAEDDDVRVRGGRLPAELQGVAGVVRDGQVQGRLHVVVPQDHRVALLLERVDPMCKLGLVPDLELGHDLRKVLPHPLVKLGHGGCCQHARVLAG